MGPDSSTTRTRPSSIKATLQMLVYTKATRPALNALFLYCDRGDPLFSGREKEGRGGAVARTATGPEIMHAVLCWYTPKLSFELASLALLDVVLVAAFVVLMGVGLAQATSYQSKVYCFEKIALFIILLAWLLLLLLRRRRFLLLSSIPQLLRVVLHYSHTPLCSTSCYSLPQSINQSSSNEILLYKQSKVCCVASTLLPAFVATSHALSVLCPARLH